MCSAPTGSYPGRLLARSAISIPDGLGGRQRVRTQGGEALPIAIKDTLDAPDGLADGGLAQWYALYTRGKCEQLVYDQLAAKGFHLFLPKLQIWSRRSGLRHAISLPMFPGYLFLQHAIDKVSYLEVRKARGLVRILGERWDRLAVVPEGEIDAVRRVVCADQPVNPYPYLREGQRVRIIHGPLAGVEGILVHSHASKGLLVLSIELLQRSLAVQVDCTAVAAA